MRKAAFEFPIGRPISEDILPLGLACRSAAPRAGLGQRMSDGCCHSLKPTGRAPARAVSNRHARSSAIDYLDAVGPELNEAWTALASARCCCKIGSALEATLRTVGLYAFDFSDWNLVTTFS
jgi:hypothetical protein